MQGQESVHFQGFETIHNNKSNPWTSRFHKLEYSKVVGVPSPTLTCQICSKKQDYPREGKATHITQRISIGVSDFFLKLEFEEDSFLIVLISMCAHF